MHNPTDCSLSDSSVCRIFHASGLPTAVDLPDPGIKSVLPAASTLAGEFFTTAPPGFPRSSVIHHWMFFCLVLFWVSFDTNIISPLEVQIFWSQNQIRFCRTPQAVSKKEGRKGKLRAVWQEIRRSLKEISHSPHCNLLTVCWQKVPGRSLWIS